MLDDDVSDSDGELVTANEVQSTKKRKKTGRVTDVMKLLRASSFETGEDCRCKRYKCFKNVSANERNALIKQFNDLGLDGGTDAQYSYLGGLISLQPVFRRRPRKPEDQAKQNDGSYTYKVRVMREGSAVEVPVCFKGFQSLFGVKPYRLHTIKTSIMKTGKSPKDKRGKHSNRPHKLSDEKRKLVMDFLASLKGRQAHYSLKDSKNFEFI